MTARALYVIPNLIQKTIQMMDLMGMRLLKLSNRPKQMEQVSSTITQWIKSYSKSFRKKISRPASLTSSLKRKELKRTPILLRLVVKPRLLMIMKKVYMKIMEKMNMTKMEMGQMIKNIPILKAQTLILILTRMALDMMTKMPMTITTITRPTNQIS